MGSIKDGFDIGVEALQFWARFKGRRVRVWPSDLTIRVCSESGKKWVASADGRTPSWWEATRQRYQDEKTNLRGKDSTLVDYAATRLANSELPNIETVEEAKLLEATIADVIKNPPGIFLTNIQFWAVLDGSDGKNVAKVDSTDEGMLLPLDKLARIDFITPSGTPHPLLSSWNVGDMEPHGL
jgi:hypothetical protein